MTAKDALEQYKDLNAELRQINNRLQVLSAEPAHFASDSVLASPAHEPYQNRPIPIRGNVQEKDVSEEFQSLTKYYKHLRKKLYAECLHAESIIARVDDPKARTIIRYRYIDGMEWNEIADKLDDGSTMDSVRMYTKRFLKNL
ncbi:MAG: hypothetical protein LKJ59_01610 [Oscillospiraceae bacterium]|nr:hypothetical protein [Oscillospiraceae bacterium]MCI2034809.1 hypothetical protein [Oscillospiraceae bacterium]